MDCPPGQHVWRDTGQARDPDSGRVVIFFVCDRCGKTKTENL